jgi:hypothetical protein
MSPNMLVVTTTSNRPGARTTCAIIASTSTSSSAIPVKSRATSRQHSRNMPSPILSTLALCTAVTRPRRRRASSKAARAIRTQQPRVIRRSETATSGVTSISPLPDAMLRSA